jgi:UDP-2-acetamido-3-amino-2,3-dideoxy-glucuronate N-acetyltransferase
MTTTIQPSAIVDQGAQIGEGSRVWHFVYVCRDAKIGQGVSLGKTCSSATKSPLATAGIEKNVSAKKTCFVLSVLSWSIYIII